MKSHLLAFSFAFVIMAVSSAQASDNTENSALVGAQAVARTALAKKFKLHSSHRQVIREALEGKKGSAIVGMQCQPMAKADKCSIALRSADGDGEFSAWELIVEVKGGTVISAMLDLIAG